MKSQTATQILYDDPNSFFRASKQVALHEKIGASLKTSKPRFEDTKLALATSSRVMQFINELDGIDTRMRYISQNMINNVPFLVGTIENSAREVLKYIGMANSSMRALKNSTTISQEDLQQMYSILVETAASIDGIKHDADIGEIDGVILNSPTFNKLMNTLDKFYGTISNFISIKQTGNNNIIGPAQPFDEIPPPEEMVQEPYIDGGNRRILGASSGHFKVLSDRAREIQGYQYKRFA